MTEAVIPGALATLRGSKLVEVSQEGYVWYFQFDPPFTLSVACVWRLTSGGSIVVTDKDHDQLFGLDQPVDAAEHVRKAVGDNVVAELTMRCPSSDLIVTFFNGAVLELISNSCGYENWHFFAGDGREGRVLGGGRLQA